MCVGGGGGGGGGVASFTSRHLILNVILAVKLYLVMSTDLIILYYCFQWHTNFWLH